MTIERIYPHLSLYELILWNNQIQPETNARNTPLYELSSDSLRLIVLTHINPDLCSKRLQPITLDLLVAAADILMQRLESGDPATAQVRDIYRIRQLAEYILSHADTMRPTPQQEAGPS